MTTRLTKWLDLKWIGHIAHVFIHTGYTDPNDLCNCSQDEIDHLLTLIELPGHRLKARILIDDLRQCHPVSPDGSKLSPTQSPVSALTSVDDDLHNSSATDDDAGSSSDDDDDNDDDDDDNGDASEGEKRRTRMSSSGHDSFDTEFADLMDAGGQIKSYRFRAFNDIASELRGDAPPARRSSRPAQVEPRPPSPPSSDPPSVDEEDPDIPVEDDLPPEPPVRQPTPNRFSETTATSATSTTNRAHSRLDDMSRRVSDIFGGENALDVSAIRMPIVTPPEPPVETRRAGDGRHHHHHDSTIAAKDQPGAILSGYAMLCLAKSSKHFARRYVVLIGQQLLWFKDENDLYQTGMVDLRRVRVAVKLHEHFEVIVVESKSTFIMIHTKDRQQTGTWFRAIDAVSKGGNPAGVLLSPVHSDAPSPSTTATTAGLSTPVSAVQRATENLCKGIRVSHHARLFDD